MAFLDDIRQIQKVDQFAGGNNKQRTKLNGLVDGLNEIVDAANRHAPQPDNGAGGALPTFVAYIADGGEAVLYQFYGAPALEP